MGDAFFQPPANKRNIAKWTSTTKPDTCSTWRFQPSWKIFRYNWIQLDHFHIFGGEKKQKSLKPFFPTPHLTKHGVVFKDPKVFSCYNWADFSKKTINSTNFVSAEICVQWPLKRRRRRWNTLGWPQNTIMETSMLSRVTPSLQCCLEKGFHFF